MQQVAAATTTSPFTTLDWCHSNGAAGLIRGVEVLGEVQTGGWRWGHQNTPRLCRSRYYGPARRRGDSRTSEQIGRCTLLSSRQRSGQRQRRAGRSLSVSGGLQLALCWPSELLLLACSTTPSRPRSPAPGRCGKQVAGAEHNRRHLLSAGNNFRRGNVRTSSSSSGQLGSGPTGLEELETGRLGLTSALKWAGQATDVI